MIKTILTRLKQGYRTIPYPAKSPVLPDRFRGLPVVDRSKCGEKCAACVAACPTGACAGGTDFLDMGKCIFCTACVRACPAQALTFTKEYRLACAKRDDCIIRDKPFIASATLGRKLRSLFGRSIKLRQVSAGGCNACEADINVLGTVVFDIGRFGIQIVTSPRHADGLLVTGPVTENMRLALQKTYDATPDPKIVVAAGACAISGGIYRDFPAQHNGADSILPVDLYIPGCPPHPLTILDGLLRALGKIKTK